MSDPIAKSLSDVEAQLAHLRRQITEAVESFMRITGETLRPDIQVTYRDASNFDRVAFAPDVRVSLNYKLFG